MAQFDGIYTIEPEGKVQITLNKSATYTLLIGVLESDTTVTEKVMPRNFDCNQSSTQAEIDAAGEVTMNSLSTLMACDVETDSMNESP